MSFKIENVRLNSSFFSYKNTTTFWTCNPFLKENFLFYILSYQSDSLTSTKNALFNTNFPAPRKKWRKKTYVFISHFEIESYPFKAQHLISDFTPYFTPKIPHLRVHYINQHIPINQIVTKITQMQKTPFLRITAKNNPF